MFSSVQSLSHVQLFVTPWTTVRQASPSCTRYQSLLKLMSIKSVMPLNHAIFCHPLLLPHSFPVSGSFPMSQFFASGGQSIGTSASASVLPMNIQEWFPLGWTCWISLQSKGLSRVFSNTTVVCVTYAHEAYVSCGLICQKIFIKIVFLLAFEHLCFTLDFAFVLLVK